MIKNIDLLIFNMSIQAFIYIIFMIRNNICAIIIFAFINYIIKYSILISLKPIFIIDAIFQVLLFISDLLIINIVEINIHFYEMIILYGLIIEIITFIIYSDIGFIMINYCKFSILFAFYSVIISSLIYFFR